MRAARRKAAGRVCSSALLALLLLATPQLALGKKKPSQPPCQVVEFAESVEHNELGFCAHPMFSFSGDVTGFALYVSKNGGHSWEKRAATGLTVQSTSDSVRRIFFSPAYPDDQTIYVQTAGGLYSSSDNAKSFVLVDSLATGLLEPYAPAPGLINPGPRLAFVMAQREMSAHIDPPLHLPVAGAPDEIRRFLVPEDFGETGEAFLFAHRDDAAGGEPAAVLYSCDSTLTCVEQLHAFPSGQSLIAGAWLAPDYAKSKRIFVVTENAREGTHMAWIGDDKGARFRPWTAVQGLLDKMAEFDLPPTEIGLASNTAFPKLLYLKLVAPDPDAASSPLAPPSHQLFKSVNAGKSFRRIGWSRWTIAEQEGNLPWHRAYGSTTVSLESDGRLIATGEFLTQTKSYVGMFCSINGGRTWSRGCPRPQR